MTGLPGATFIGSLIWHSDELVSSLTCEFLQRVVVEKSSVRCFIVTVCITTL